MKSHAFGVALLSAVAIVPAQTQNGSLTRSFVSSAAGFRRSAIGLIAEYHLRVCCVQFIGNAYLGQL